MSLEAVLALLGVVLINTGGFLYYLESRARSGLMIPCHQHPPGRYSRPGFWLLILGFAFLAYAAWPFFRIFWGFRF